MAKIPGRTAWLPHFDTLWPALERQEGVGRADTLSGATAVPMTLCRVKATNQIQTIIGVVNVW